MWAEPCRGTTTRNRRSPVFAKVRENLYVDFRVSFFVTTVCQEPELRRWSMTGLRGAAGRTVPAIATVAPTGTLAATLSVTRGGFAG